MREELDIFVELVTIGMIDIKRLNMQPEWLIIDFNTFYHLKSTIDFVGLEFIPKEHLHPDKKPIDRFMGLKIALVDTPSKIFEVK